MITTIKVTEETKKRIMSLNLSEKGKTFDMILNELITYYMKSEKEYIKDYKNWKKAWKKHTQNVKVYEKQQKRYELEIKGYDKNKETWKKLVKWAESKGFKK